MNLQTTRRVLLTTVVAIGLFGTSTVRANEVTFMSVDLDLDDPSTGANTFSTIFRVTDLGTGISIDGGPEIVDYLDLNQSGLQVNRDIDFSDLGNPVVNSIEFVGEPGDIDHVFVGGAIPVEFNDLLVNIDLDAEPDGVRGFLRTQGGPIAVNPDGSFVSGNTNLVARQGTVDIDGTITPIIGGPILVDETFSLADTPLDQFNDSISAGALNDVSVDFVGIDGNQRVYSVVVSTELQNTELPFTVDGFALTLDITGTLLGRGEVRIDVIPEPVSLSLMTLGLALAVTTRRRVRA